jgi:hypothetical protein
LFVLWRTLQCYECQKNGTENQKVASRAYTAQTVNSKQEEHYLALLSSTQNQVDLDTSHMLKENGPDQAKTAISTPHNQQDRPRERERERERERARERERERERRRERKIENSQ